MEPWAEAYSKYGHLASRSQCLRLNFWSNFAYFTRTMRNKFQRRTFSSHAANDWDDEVRYAIDRWSKEITDAVVEDLHKEEAAQEALNKL